MEARCPPRPAPFCFNTCVVSGPGSCLDSIDGCRILDAPLHFPTADFSHAASPRRVIVVRFDSCVCPPSMHYFYLSLCDFSGLALQKPAPAFHCLHCKVPTSEARFRAGRNADDVAKSGLTPGASILRASCIRPVKFGGHVECVRFDHPCQNPRANLRQSMEMPRARGIKRRPGLLYDHNQCPENPNQRESHHPLSWHRTQPWRRPVNC